MKFDDPKNIALLIAFIITLLSSILLILFGFVDLQTQYLKLIILDIIVFASLFLSLKYSLEKFIHDKIKIIYKSKKIKVNYEV